MLAQTTPDKNYFRSPLGIPLFLSGSFGELRSNHFHSGIDIKTQGKEGFRIYACADGFVSRIKISPWGYGYAVYVDHPNGYTTVYAHLKSLKGKIAEVAKKHQYEMESWEVDFYLTDSILPVKKGDVIALSGNTGGSGGPHLHFEIRETKSEHPVNPLLFGFDIKDNIPPTIKRIGIYPLNDTSYVNGKKTPRYIDVIKSNHQFRLKTSSPLYAYGEIGVGIETIDRFNEVPNQNGVYAVTLEADDVPIYHSEMKKFSFDQTRALNSLIDYEKYIRSRRRIQQSFIDPNNKLMIYDRNKGSGHITMKNQETKKLKYLVKDINNNTSELSFSINGGQPKDGISASINAKVDTILTHNNTNTFMARDLVVNFPKNTLYNDLPFEYHTSKAIKNAVSPTHHVHNDYTPLHDYITISIKPTNLPDDLKSKAVMVHSNKKNKLTAVGGTWYKDFLIAETKLLGKYAIMVDSVAPLITPINISPNKNMKHNSAIIVKIGDNLSGIKQFRGMIDGKWIVMEYEAKRAQLIHRFEALAPGKHTFTLEVKDDVENSSTIEIPFIR